MRLQQYRNIIFAFGLMLLYNDWLLGPLLNPRLSWSRSLISELSAGTQSFHWVFQSMDITAGVLTLAALPWLWKFLRKSQVPYWQVLFITIATIGADSIADALMPIACAPSVDAGCNLATTSSVLTQAHLIESTLIGIATFLAPLLWWRFCKAKHRFISQASLWFAAFQIAIGVSILLTRAIHYDVTGAMQRGYELSISLWVCGILFATMTTERRPVDATQEASSQLSYDPKPSLTSS